MRGSIIRFSYLPGQCLTASFTRAKMSLMDSFVKGNKHV
jgi:hypothetical protein